MAFTVKGNTGTDNNTTTTATKAAPRKDTPMNIVKLSAKAKDGNWLPDVLLFERSTKNGGTFFVGNPRVKNDDGTFTNLDTAFYAFPNKDGVRLKVRQVKDGDIEDVGMLEKDRRQDGAYIGTLGEMLYKIQPYTPKPKA